MKLKEVILIVFLIISGFVISGLAFALSYKILQLMLADIFLTSVFGCILFLLDVFLGFAGTLLIFYGLFAIDR